jgi:uncharacterized protein
MLLLSGRCNQRCAYCFAVDGIPLEDLSPEAAKHAMKRYLVPDRDATVQFAGGEPFLAFPAMAELIDWGRMHYPLVRFAVQTNGTLGDEGQWDYLVQRRVGIGISLDGAPRVNERQRGDTARVLATLASLQTMGVGVNITAVVTGDSIGGLGELLLLCGSFPCIRTVNLDIVRPVKGRGVSIPSEEQIDEMVDTMFRTLQYVNARRVPPLRIREIEQVRSHRSSHTPQPFCHGAAGQALAVTPDEQLYPCAALVGDSRFRVGHIGEEVVERAGVLACAGVYPEQCVDCPVRFACRGGCPSRRIAYTGNVEEPSEPECRLYRQIHRRLTNARSG